MVVLWRRIGVSIVLVGSVGLAGCSSSDSDSASSVNLDSIEADTDATATAGEVADDDTDADLNVPDDGSATDEAPATPEPLRSNGSATTAPPDVESTSAYITRLSMAANTIEVKWSQTEGVAEYHIHRLPRISDAEPGVEAMTAGNRIHVADERGSFADNDVEAGSEYWHGVREISAGGDVTAHGWHETAAIDDEEPPSTVNGITAVADNGEVLVTWTEPDENYQLHGYRVLRGVDGEPSEQIAITWRLDQRSFIDDEPPTSAEVVYEVVAFDFHWNDSSPGGVAIDLS